ncbi:NAD(P)/FAD-dependent oxidoreductase [Pseudonocardia halophobica]|uniref:Monooxygenase n=1 Tax=Pseudonocardia halophobica TaxID=29401 RepID=A0A9W6L5I4_9PSEU|nr:NAD(P)/FAD-dependent oxidoreductase [Pseudonocardia halophobica]GLL13320.1 monooxygenase [Pseudonocardia halophobica]
MTNSGQELGGATDDEIRAALAVADPMTLRGLLYQLTGDESLARLPVTLAPAGNAEAMRLADKADAALVREKALRFLAAHRDRGAPDLPLGPADRLPRSMGLVAGVELPADELECWTEELAVDPFARGLRWPRTPDPEALAGFSVLVIGAGLGGLGAAVQLERAGIPYTVVEKNPGVGGTWYENRYPGARVDTPSRAYTHLFGVDYEYPNPFCEQAENEKYFNWVADTFGVRPHIEFDTEVRSAVWDEAAARWRVTLASPEGEREIAVNAVISAVGFLARPNIPDLPGAELFEGAAFHSARWPAGLDLEGARVGVIGSGCTSYQMAPELAGTAGHLSIFQRTPQWVFDRPGYRTAFPPEATWLDRNVPWYRNFQRLRVSWLSGPHVQSAAFTIDPEWSDPHTLSALNARLREQRLEFLQRKLAGRPDLVTAMTPDHPPMSARPVVVDPGLSVVDTLLRDDVDLVTAPITEVTATGVSTADGADHPLDVLVYATGFRANDFLWPMEIRGRGGRRVEDLWARDGARAWLGTMLPGFPNFFLLYGPNMNPFSLGVVTFSEMTTRFALDRVAELVLSGRSSVEVTEEAYDSYNTALDARERTRTWSDPRVDNYYRNAHGRSAANCPFEGTEMWRWLRHPEPGDLVVR